MINFIRQRIPDAYFYPDYGKAFLTESKLQNLLNLLAECIEKNVEGDIIECGVFRGGSLLQFALLAKKLNSNKKLYGIDTFEGHPYDSPNDMAPDGKIYNYKGYLVENNYERVKQIFEKRNLDEVILYKGLAEEVLLKLSREKICFAHIDMDIYQSTKNALLLLLPMMSKNGIIVFDDYGGHTTSGVKRAVEEILNKNDVKILTNSEKDGSQAFWINR